MSLPNGAAGPSMTWEVVYMWVDGVYVKAGLEKEKAAVLVVMAALSDGSKVVVSAVPGYRELQRVGKHLSSRAPKCSATPEESEAPDRLSGLAKLQDVQHAAHLAGSPRAASTSYYVCQSNIKLGRDAC